MRRALDPEHDLIGEDEPPRDLVLGIPALLGIFVAAVLICAVCFGFGYSSGHGFHFPAKTSTAANATAAVAKPAPMPLPSQPDASEDTDNALPAPVDAASETGTTAAAPPAVHAKPSPGMSAMQPPSTQVSEAPAETAPPQSGYSPAVRATSPAAAPQASVTARGPAQPLAEQPAASLGLMVQIAAVTQFADAETLSKALRHDGFSAVVRTTTGDPYFHVQVGPFATYDAAKAMRQRLVSSGYSAFIRH